MDAICEFAGEDCTRAVLYADDEQYFLAFDSRRYHGLLREGRRDHTLALLDS